MKCPNCNNPVLPDDNFCGNCGHRLSSEEEIYKNNDRESKEFFYTILAITFVGILLIVVILSIIPPITSENQFKSNQQDTVEEYSQTFSGELPQNNVTDEKVTCEPPNIFCNDKCWTPCSKGQRFVCPSNGDAYCEEEDKKLLLKSNNELYSKIIQELINKQGSTVKNLEISNNSDFLDVSKYVSSVAKIECPLDKDLNLWSVGSGFLINNSGNILTNYHIIDSSYDNTCLVSFTDDFQKPPYKGYIAYLTKLYDPELDYAVLYLFKEIDISTGKIIDIKNRNFPYIPACNSDIVKLGDPILILGYPSYGGTTLTVTNGIISGSLGYYFKTDAKIDKGNSGGPVLLDDPEKDCYIGIATFGIKGYFESIGGILKSKYIPLYNW